MGLILHGGGGVGKSVTLRVCAQWAEQILKRAGDNPKNQESCFCVPQASVIDGMTIFSSLDHQF